MNDSIPIVDQLKDRVERLLTVLLTSRHQRALKEEELDLRLVQLLLDRLMLKLEQSTFDDRCQAPQEVTDLIQATQTDVGTERLQKHLNQLPFPHFEAHPDDPELLIRIDESGQRTAGRFVDRKFVAVQP